MNSAQISNLVLEHTKEIEALKGSMKTAFNRLDNFDKVADSVHELAKNVAAMTSEVRQSNMKAAEDLSDIKQGQRRQSERLGQIEKDITQIQRNEKEISDLADKLDAVRIEPGEKWKYLVFALIGGLAAGILGVLGGGLFF